MSFAVRYAELSVMWQGLRSRAVESLGRMDGSGGCRIAIVEGVGRGGGYDECWRCGRTWHQARDCDQIPQVRRLPTSLNSQHSRNKRSN